MANANGNYHWPHSDSERNPSMAERFLSYLKRFCPYLI